MISLQSQIKLLIIFLLANIPSISLNQCSFNALRPSSKKASLDRIPLILPFNPSIYQLRRIILKHYKALMTDQDTKDIFKLLPIVSCKRERNLCNHLVCASEPQSPMFSDAAFFLLNADVAIHANLLLYIYILHINCPKGSFNVTETFTFISKNIVYGIIYKRCNM